MQHLKLGDKLNKHLRNKNSVNFTASFFLHLFKLMTGYIQFGSLYTVKFSLPADSEDIVQVYYQLENSSRADPPYKSVAALNCVILGCANIWDIDHAYQRFTAIESTFELTPYVHSYNALINAFGKLSKVKIDESKIFIKGLHFFLFLTVTTLGLITHHPL